MNPEYLDEDLARRIDEVIIQAVDNYDKGLRYVNGTFVSVYPAQTVDQKNAALMDKCAKINETVAARPDLFASIFAKFGQVDIGQLCLRYLQEYALERNRKAISALYSYYTEPTPLDMLPTGPFATLSMVPRVPLRSLVAFQPEGLYPSPESPAGIILGSVYDNFTMDMMYVAPGQYFTSADLELCYANVRNHLYPGWQ